MSNILDAVLQQYESNKIEPKSDSNRMSQDERLKKYFTTTDGTSPFKEVWFHEVQVGGRWMKIYDPGKNEGKRSPLNEVNEALMMTGSEQDKILARQYKSRKFYIVKVIDQDKPEDGVKFWRFKHNYKGDGILDKIIPIWKNKGDVTEPNNGRDLILSLSLVKAPNGKEYTNVSSIMYDDPTPISTDAAQMTEWLSNEMTWEDVYSKKPEEYLEAIAQGHEPRWSTELGKYVYGDGEDLVEISGNTSTTAKVETTTQTEVKIEDTQANAKVDEDLPF